MSTQSIRGGASLHAPAIAALAGAATVFGYAPFYYYWLPLVTFALLIALIYRAPSCRAAMFAGFCFGLGLFLGGVSWVYVSLHDYGAMPAALAGFLTLVFCAFLACFPALACGLYWMLRARSTFVAITALPALWTLSEWVRGWIFTGFPWLAVGYTQVPASPLAGYIPIIGVYGVTLATLITASILALAWIHWKNFSSATDSRPPRLGRGHPALFGAAAMWLIGFLLLHVDWTHPDGTPLSVALLQGNIPQEMKWREDKMRATLKTYHDMVLSTDARLIILPETALPLFLHEVPPYYIDQLAAHARANGGDVLVGVPERSDARNYYNSVLTVGTAPMQTYRKTHLVPFGEFVPFKPLFAWFLEIAQIPLLDFSRGDPNQRPLTVGGQRIAINICYEDAFGAEIIRQLPEATLLANVSNVAWFGRSIAPAQHLQISQARALETGRYMLRATNSGMTAIVDQRGQVQQVAPEFTAAIVSGEVQGYTGTTPYVQWGDYVVLGLIIVLLVIAVWRGARETSNIPGH